MLQFLEFNECDLTSLQIKVPASTDFKLMFSINLFTSVLHRYLSTSWQFVFIITSFKKFCAPTRLCSHIIQQERSSAYLSTTTHLCGPFPVINEDVLGTKTWGMKWSESYTIRQRRGCKTQSSRGWWESVYIWCKSRQTRAQITLHDIHRDERTRHWDGDPCTGV